MVQFLKQLRKEQKTTAMVLFRHHIWLKHPKIANILHSIERRFMSNDIPSGVTLGGGCIFAHQGLGVVIDRRTVIGDNCKIYQHVTIGFRNDYGPPVIGDNVLIGAGAVVLGDITIGNNVKIGANAVVLESVPDNCTVVGNPARIVKRD